MTPPASSPAPGQPDFEALAEREWSKLLGERQHWPWLEARNEFTKRIFILGQQSAHAAAPEGWNEAIDQAIYEIHRAQTEAAERLLERVRALKHPAAPSRTVSRSRSFRTW